jgi:hypothetical protein
VVYMGDAAARRGGGAGEDRFAHPQGLHQRGAAGLGDQCGHHALLAGNGRRTASLPGDGARLPPGHRVGGPRAGAGPVWPVARCGGRLRRWRLQRDRHLPPVHRRPGSASGRLRSCR